MRVSVTIVGVRRRLFAIAASGSLLLLAATLVLWVRSYRALTSVGDADHFDFTHADPYYWIISNRGRLTFCGQTGHDWNHPAPVFNVLNLELAYSRVGASSLWNLLIPYWMLAVVSLIVPAAYVRSTFRAVARHRRSARCLCFNCGYDLRGNTSGVCPECGKRTSAHTACGNPETTPPSAPMQ